MREVVKKCSLAISCIHLILNIVRQRKVVPVHAMKGTGVVALSTTRRHIDLSGTYSGPGRFTCGIETRYPLYCRLGEAQGRSGWVRIMSLLPGFDTRTVQAVASCFTGYTIRADGQTLYVQK
jgi:hypothetical protein